MNTLSIYTDIDTLFDTRRGIIEIILNAKGNDWSDYQNCYKGRTIDYFDAPHLGLTHDKYMERFSQRNTDDWCGTDRCHFYPTNILKNILPLVRSIEFGSFKTIMVAEIKLYINMYPFEMSESLQIQLINHLKVFFKIPIDVQIINLDYEQQTANAIGSYQYVFRYGHLINPDFKKWFDTFPSSTKEGIKFIVPDLLAKPIEDIDDLEPLKNESTKTLIEKMSSLQGGRCIFIPVDKNIFDYSD